jgi:prepilin-type N-terminal cleavage/methylation domain-containing protein
LSIVFPGREFMPKRRHRIRAGFTLLEIVTVLVIALIMGAMAFPQINRYWQSYRLDAATQTLTSNLELARYSAISKNLNVVVAFYPATGNYELFEDKNGNGSKDTGEALIGSYSLPSRVEFKGNGLLGPPSNPSGPVADPITFTNDRVVFNSQGKLNAGLGTIYVQNAATDATAISFNIAGRMKTFRWDKASKTWR